MSEPLFPLYKDAKCVSSRKDLAAINGVRVGVIRRRERDDGVWEYTVSPNNSYVYYVCEEAELAPVVPVNLFADDCTFTTIRRALQYGFHQDWDSQFDSLAEALVAGIGSVELAKFRTEVAELELQPDEIVREVLDDHNVSVLDLIAPKDFLVALRALADLM